MDRVTAPDGTEYIEFNLKNYLDGGLIREDSFFKAMEEVDWTQCAGENVIVRSCGSDPMPPWTFMLATAKLIPHASNLYFGQVGNLVLINRKEAG